MLLHRTSLVGRYLGSYLCARGCYTGVLQQKGTLGGWCCVFFRGRGGGLDKPGVVEPVRWRQRKWRCSDSLRSLPPTPPTPPFIECHIFMDLGILFFLLDLRADWRDCCDQIGTSRPPHHLHGALLSFRLLFPSCMVVMGLVDGCGGCGGGAGSHVLCRHFRQEIPVHSAPCDAPSELPFWCASFLPSVFVYCPCCLFRV